MPGVIEEIDKTIKEREKTDRIMSFGSYFVVFIIISAIILVALLSQSIEGMVIGAIFAIIFGIYVLYLLIKREEHLKRERKFLYNLILLFEGKVDESRINLLRTELRERENEEEEKNPLLWAILGSIPYVGLYVYYFLTTDFYRHNKREEYTLQYINKAMQDMGAAFLFSMKPSNQGIPKRNFILYLVLTILTFGIFGIYWFYTLFRDPNVHFAYQKEWENSLLDAVKALGVTQSQAGVTQSQAMKTPVTPVQPYTQPYTQPHINGGTKVFTDNGLLTKTTSILVTAELALPERTIGITSDKIAFGRNDFENDLSSEKLGYISSKTADRYHFMITRQDDTFYIQDDFSTNGTKLNDTEIKNKGKIVLKNDDKIMLAGIDNFIITFKIKN